MTFKDTIQLRRAKLKSKKEHLEALLNKRARLDYEINVLKRSLRKSLNTATKNTLEECHSLAKEQLILNEMGTLDPGPILFYMLAEQAQEGLYNEINEFDSTCEEILEILERT